MATTKKEMFATIKSLLSDNAEVVEFCDHEIDLLSRKSSGSRKPTKTQVENEGFKADILELLDSAESPLSITDMQEQCPSLTDLANQRISALLNQLIKADKVVRIKDKKKTFYSIAIADEE